MNSIKIAALLSLSVIAIGGLTAHAKAADFTVPATVVRFGDLNLGAQSGAKVLLSRINNAARRMCAPQLAVETYKKGIWQACFDTAVRDAVSKINKPVVYGLYITQAVPHV